MIEKINVLIDLCRVYLETERAKTSTETPAEETAREEVLTMMLTRIKAAAAAL